MDVSTPQLAALLAIADLGTFEAAARHLHVTPSAVSQRIRALESAAGQVLVRRGTPCAPTAAGARLVAVARQTQLLLAEVQLAPSVVDLPLAVNADSLATWWRPVIGEVSTWEDVTLRLHVEDQAWSSDLLRRGEVLAAVTSEPHAVQGCAVERLGSMRYVPAAAPGFAHRWHTDHGYDWGAMPAVVFNDKDDLQHEVLRRRGFERSRIVHRVPTSADFHEAVRLGLGWAAIPEPQLRPDLESGALVALSRHNHVDVDLYWQRWRLTSPLLDRLTDAVRRAGAGALRP
jgi:LysR family transcriptional regulator (chromosome initiation inhibitor)